VTRGRTSVSRRPHRKAPRAGGSNRRYHCRVLRVSYPPRPKPPNRRLIRPEHASGPTDFCTDRTSRFHRRNRTRIRPCCIALKP